MIISQRWPWKKINFLRQVALFSTGATATMTQAGNSSYSFEEAFSVENKRRTIDDLSKLTAKYKLEKCVSGIMRRKAAVLVPLCYDTQNRPSILFNLRSRTMNKHRGEISFPGGAVDPEDNDDVIVTALRETHEELGISKDQVEIWICLSFVPTVTSLVRVAPVVGFIKEPVDPAKLNISPDEVEFAFTVPLEHLCDSKNWDMTHYTKNSNKYSMPAFKNLEEFMGGKENTVSLWGLTAIVTHVVLLSLVPQAYQRDIPLNGRITRTKDTPQAKI